MAFWQLRVFHYNALGRRFDYKKTWSKRLPRIINLINAIKPDVITLVECQAAEAKEIASATNYKATTYLGSTILTRKGLTVKTLKTYSWLKNYPHSALVVEVKNEQGFAVNVAASHLPPFAYRAALRKTQQKKLCQLFDGWSDASIIATDANWSKTFESFVKTLGWLSARVSSNMKFRTNYRTSAASTSGLYKTGNPIDYIIAKSGKKNPVKFEYYSVLDGSQLPGGDHNPIEVIAICGTVPSLPTN